MLTCGIMSSKQETKNKILRTALKLFSEKGFEATTTKSIAKKSGFNELTIFRHFDNKRNLFYRCIEEQLDVKNDLIDIDLEPSEDLNRDLTEKGLKIGKNMVERSELIKVVLMETKNHPDFFKRFSHIPNTALETIQEYFDNAKDEGLIKDLDTEMLAIAFYSFFFRILVSNAFIGNDPFMDLNEKNVRKFVEIFVNRIKKEEKYL